MLIDLRWERGGLPMHISSSNRAQIRRQMESLRSRKIKAIALIGTNVIGQVYHNSQNGGWKLWFIDEKGIAT